MSDEYKTDTERDCDDLEKENAELRELVREMAVELKSTAELCCDRMCRPGVHMDECLRIQNLLSRARKALDV